MIESPFIRDQWEQARRERAARSAERLAWLAYGAAVGMLVGFIIFTFAR